MERKTRDGLLRGIERGSIINVQAYKHDGTLYRQWNGVKVLEVNLQEVVLFMFKTKVLEKKGQRWTIKEPMIWFFPIDEWYNTTALVRSSGIYYYTNLASPPTFEDNTIKFIDYDLDVKCYPGQKIKLVDSNDFKKHIEEMGYPEKLITLINDQAKVLMDLATNKDGFFDPEVIKFWIEDLIKNKLLGKKYIEKTNM